jgi:hypothetical protein
MSKDRFITPVFAGGTRDTVVGTSINGYAIGEWADKVDERIASLTDNLYNLLQGQVQKVSLGFPASVPNIKDLGDIKIDSITKDISHDIVIDPNPPKLYDEIFPVDDIAKHLTSYAEVLHRDIQACSDPVAKHGVIDELAEVNGLLQKLRGVQDRGI